MAALLAVLERDATAPAAKLAECVAHPGSDGLFKEGRARGRYESHGPLAQDVAHPRGSAMTGRMLAASGALALFVAGVFVMLVVAVAGEREAARLARGSAEATAATSELEKLVIDLQTGLRGYVIAGDPRFLEPSRRARRLLPGQSRLVRGAVASDPSQRALAERIAGRIGSYIDDYRQPVALGRADAGGCRRRRSPRSGLRQPDLERDQVHARGRSRRAEGVGARRRGARRVRGHRHRHTGR